MDKILFDSSVHLGQFCLSDEGIRIWCKNQQASFLERDVHGPKRVGMWTDNDNGRVDRTIWSLPPEVQAAYYPFMDRYFSTRLVVQDPMCNKEICQALQFNFRVPGLDVQSLLTCARAISERVQEVHTLFRELLHPHVVHVLAAEHGIIVKGPETPSDENVYADHQLEESYQHCLATLRTVDVDLLERLKDIRRRLVSLSLPDARP